MGFAALDPSSGRGVVRVRAALGSIAAPAAQALLRRLLHRPRYAHPARSRRGMVRLSDSISGAVDDIPRWSGSASPARGYLWHCRLAVRLSLRASAERRVPVAGETNREPIACIPSRRLPTGAPAMPSWSTARAAEPIGGALTALQCPA